MLSFDVDDSRFPLLQGIIADSSKEERLMMLFGCLVGSVRSAALRGAAGAPEAKDSLCNAIDVIGFLRGHLRKEHVTPFGVALRRFLNRAHRGMIDAFRDNRPRDLLLLEASSLKLTTPPLSEMFFMAAARDTEIGEAELVAFLHEHTKAEELINAA
jgi:hypothetical protein